jgi:hypothetical protein
MIFFWHIFLSARNAPKLTPNYTHRGVGYWRSKGGRAERDVCYVATPCLAKVAPWHLFSKVLYYSEFYIVNILGH